MRSFLISFLTLAAASAESRTFAGLFFQLGQLVLELVALARLLGRGQRRIAPPGLLAALVRRAARRVRAVCARPAGPRSRSEQLGQTQRRSSGRAFPAGPACGQLELELARDGVRQLARGFDGMDRLDELGRQPLAELDEAFERRQQRPTGAVVSAERSSISLVVRPRRRRSLRSRRNCGWSRAACPRPAPSPCRRAGARPGSRWPGFRPERCPRARAPGFPASAGQKGRSPGFPRAPCLAQCAERLLAPHEKRDHHVRKNHDVPQGQEWNALQDGFVFAMIGHGARIVSTAGGGQPISDYLRGKPSQYAQ
jgi:hypothetical protein